MRGRDPTRKIGGVGEGCRQEGHTCAGGRERNGLLPHHATLRIAEVVHLGCVRV
jgi:hypothetical protein